MPRSRYPTAAAYGLQHIAKVLDTTHQYPNEQPQYHRSQATPTEDIEESVQVKDFTGHDSHRKMLLDSLATDAIPFVTSLMERPSEEIKGHGHYIVP